MDFFSIFIIGIGLAMDCFAVSVSKGICTKKFRFLQVFRMAYLFGLFQAIMPLIGYLAAFSFAEQFCAIDHWIAFGLLSIVGTKMLIEGFQPIDTHCKSLKKAYKWKTLLTLALATSIDALATGVIFAPYPDLILWAALIIGVISFLFTFAGVGLGMYFGQRFRFNTEIIGGVILIGIGTKILIEHLFTNA